MEWIETACIFILVKEDAFCDADFMDNKNNFTFSGDLEVTELKAQDEKCECFTKILSPVLL